MSTESVFDALETAREQADDLPDTSDEDLSEAIEKLKRRTAIIGIVEDIEDLDAVSSVSIGRTWNECNVANLEVHLSSDSAFTSASVNGDQQSDLPSEGESDDEKKWCGRCGEPASTAKGIKIHNGHRHEADEAIVLDEEPDEEDLVGDINEDDDPTQDEQPEEIEPAVDEADEEPEETAEELLEEMEAEEDGASEESSTASWDVGEELDDEAAEDSPEETDGGTIVEDSDDGASGDDSLDELDSIGADMPPESELRKAAESDDINSVRGLAEEFDVRPAAMRVATHKLGLYDNELSNPEGRPEPGFKQGGD